MEPFKLSFSASASRVRRSLRIVAGIFFGLICALTAVANYNQTHGALIALLPVVIAASFIPIAVLVRGTVRIDRARGRIECRFPVRAPFFELLLPNWGRTFPLAGLTDVSLERAPHGDRYRVLLRYGHTSIPLTLITITTAKNIERSPAISAGRHRSARRIHSMDIRYRSISIALALGAAGAAGAAEPPTTGLKIVYVHPSTPLQERENFYQKKKPLAAIAGAACGARGGAMRSEVP
jgi:hypothetical protein